MLSGKFVLRLDPRLHKALKEEAQIRGESLNSLCLKKISLSMTSPHAVMVRAIVEEFNPLGILLFGSSVRGESRASSDIDLLIVLHDKVSITRHLYQRWDQIFPQSSKYSPQFVHLPSFESDIGSIWLESSLEGEILYEKETIVKNVLIKIRSTIAEGQYVRKISHGHAYWVRQDSYAK